MRRALFATSILLLGALAGCSNPFAPPEPGVRYSSLEGYVRDTTGRDPDAWPDLPDTEILLLDNGAFPGFEDAAKQFAKLTGVTVKQEEGEDTGEALRKLIATKKSGKYDVVYGIDNVVLFRAVEAGALVAYKPELADRIDPLLVFFPDTGNDTWLATPVDHGYIAVNYDMSELDVPIDSLSRLRLYADQFVTSDPRVSSPGLGFLLVTIAQFGENPAYSNARYDWKAYWRDLFRGPDRDRDGNSDGCVLVARDWGEAYEQHFSAGYGTGMGGAGDKPIVVSYTESPAYEAFYGRPRFLLADVLYENVTTYHQVQTMAIANGTQNLLAAQAWVEFSLTDAFQELAAPKNAVYPVVRSVDANRTYAGLDPAPGSFASVMFSQDHLSRQDSKGVANLDRWVKQWTEMYEDTSLNCNLGASGGGPG